MHRQAAVEAMPNAEKKGVPTQLADHTLRLQWRRYHEERDLR